MYRLSPSPYVPNQLFVSQPPVNDVRQNHDEASEVVKVFAQIIAECLFVLIAVKMEGSDSV